MYNLYDFGLENLYCYINKIKNIFSVFSDHDIKAGNCKEYDITKNELRKAKDNKRLVLSKYISHEYYNTDLDCQSEAGALFINSFESVGDIREFINRENNNINNKHVGMIENNIGYDYSYVCYRRIRNIIYTGYRELAANADI